MAGNDALLEGWWTLDGLQAMIPTDVACPYCQGPLLAVVASTAARIVQVQGGADFTKESGQPSISHGLIQVLPPAYQALGCRTCVQMFTVPVDVPPPEA